MKRRRQLFVMLLAIVGAYCVARLPARYDRVRLDRQNVALSRYELELSPDIAILGSSMTSRLYEQYFSIPLRNLSVGGGSHLTSLSIIASYERLPRLILVETNIMSRPADQSLIDAFGNNASKPFRWFKPVRAAISAIYYFIKSERDTGKIDRLLQSEPVDYDISQSIATSLSEYQDERWPQLMTPIVEQLRVLVTSLEARGCRVLLFELPSAPVVRDTNYVQTAHRLAHAAFPDAGKWLYLTEQLDQLRWVDGSHMDERSAIIVARQLQNAITSLK